MPAAFADPTIWTPEYYQTDAEYVRSGVIKAFLENPANVPLYGAIERDTDAMTLGTLLHDLLLFDHRNYVVSDLNRNSNDYKALAAESAPKAMIKSTGFLSEETLNGMYDAVMAEPDAVRLLEASAFHESVVLWTDDEYGGLPCKAMLDKLCHDGTIIDLKTTRFDNPYKFQQDAFARGYHMSAVWYERGRNLVLGSDVDAEFHWIAVQNVPPYRVRIYTLTPETRDEQRQRLLVTLPEFAHCRKTGEWPDRYAGVEHPI